MFNHVIYNYLFNEENACTALCTVLKKKPHMYPCFIAVIKYGYEVGCEWIKSRHKHEKIRYVVQPCTNIIYRYIYVNNTDCRYSVSFGKISIYTFKYIYTSTLNIHTHVYNYKHNICMHHCKWVTIFTCKVIVAGNYTILLYRVRKSNIHMNFNKTPTKRLSRFTYM